MKYLKLNKCIIIAQDIKTVCRDRVFHADKWFEVVQVNYIDGQSVQVPFDTEEESKTALDEIAEVLVKLG